MIRKSLSVVLFLVAASCAGLLVFAYPYDWILEKRIHAAGVQNIIQAADRLVKVQNLPNEIKSLKPLSVLVADEGVYIQLDGYFVTAEGIFVLRKSSDFNPERHGDPFFRQMEGRLYWYYVTG
jgi:hypothetical protein